MRSGTIRRTRDCAVRQDPTYVRTRDYRLRTLPTENCHAALPRLPWATREYQSDPSSKRPDPSMLSPFPILPRPPPLNSNNLGPGAPNVKGLDKGRSIPAQ